MVGESLFLLEPCVKILTQPMFFFFFFSNDNDIFNFLLEKKERILSLILQIKKHSHLDKI